MFSPSDDPTDARRRMDIMRQEILARQRADARQRAQSRTANPNRHLVFDLYDAANSLRLQALSNMIATRISDRTIRHEIERGNAAGRAALVSLIERDVISEAEIINVLQPEQTTRPSINDPTDASRRDARQRMDMVRRVLLARQRAEAQLRAQSQATRPNINDISDDMFEQFRSALNSRSGEGALSRENVFSVARDIFSRHFQTAASRASTTSGVDDRLNRTEMTHDIDIANKTKERSLKLADTKTGIKRDIWLNVASLADTYANIARANFEQGQTQTSALDEARNALRVALKSAYQLDESEVNPDASLRQMAFKKAKLETVLNRDRVKEKLAKQYGMATAELVDILIGDTDTEETVEEILGMIKDTLLSSASTSLNDDVEKFFQNKHISPWKKRCRNPRSMYDLETILYLQPDTDIIYDNTGLCYLKSEYKAARDAAIERGSRFINPELKLFSELKLYDGARDSEITDRTEI